MNIIGLDPSLTSTGLCVNGKLFNYATKISGKTGLTKWYKMSEQFITYREIEYDKTSDTFTDSEVNKLLDYDRITNMIMEDIILNLIPDEPIKIGIEGYSYSSAAGPLIDLVTFGTILRNKLISIADEIKIFPPTRMKKFSCMMTYSMDEKKVWRNNDGLAGGSFTKFEMYKSITENTNLTDDYSNHLRAIQSDIFSGKKVPKPQEDVNDSWLCYLVMRDEIYNK